MKELEQKLIISSLLHDIGKIIYRQGADKRKHSQSGYDYLKEETKITDNEILEGVLYHHLDALKNANISEQSLAYIVYIADNIASAADRRENQSGDYGFEIATPLESIFNILNGNDGHMYYKPQTLDRKKGINYPQEEKIAFDEHFYSEIKDVLSDNLKAIALNEEYIHSLLEVLEATLTYVPSSTAKKELADISLYDHVKITAAVASCIFLYLEEQQITDYRTELLTNATHFYEKDAFLLFSMDISGIQDFIYTISSKNALKTLRARSFYLEIMMEHCIDSVLERLQLSRANVIYVGGGHCYLLVPNTEKTKQEIASFLTETNEWLTDMFQISLFLAGGYAPCSAKTLQNEPEGRFSEMFREAGNQISEKKAARYTPSHLRKLNHLEHDDYTRECRVCKNIGHVDADGVCPICKALEQFSAKILYDEFFTIVSEDSGGLLPLPGGYYITSDSRESLTKRMECDTSFVRVYGKNVMYTGKHVATKLWVGNYTAPQKDFKSMAQSAEGIERIGILRADVDNLGQTFVHGFESEKNGNHYVTLSRTATLSRQLSLFFKLYINDFLEQGKLHITENSPEKRNISIVYSGGDDLFLVGAWNEIIEAAIDIRRGFERYTEGMLTLSAGIGMYGSSYPIHSIANEVADMEDMAKKNPGKNSVTLLEDGMYHEVTEDGKVYRISDGTYTWQVLEGEVIAQKYRLLETFFQNSEDRGKAFLYRLLDLIRNQDNKINFARYVYMIARLEPPKDAPSLQMENYRAFSKQMFTWIQSEEDCRQLKTAINLYAYTRREKEEQE